MIGVFRTCPMELAPTLTSGRSFLLLASTFAPSPAAASASEPLPNRARPANLPNQPRALPLVHTRPTSTQLVLAARARHRDFSLPF
jgi:hypothetical protein